MACNKFYYSKFKLFFYCIIALNLVACTTETLPIRESVRIAGKDGFVRDRFGVCLPELGRTPIIDPVIPASDNEFIAGYNNHVIRGQSCHKQDSFAYSGAFLFNMSGLEDKVITQAVLRIDRRNTNVPISVTREARSGTITENRCRLMLEAITRDWEPGSSGKFLSRPIPASGTTEFTQDSSTIEIGVDVQWIVQQWAMARLYNFGFVLKPKQEDIGQNENTCTGYWFNPRLEITIAVPEE